MASSVKVSGVEDVLAKLARVKVNTLRAVDVQMGALANDMENYAKDHRTWTDRTGDARRSINGSSGTSGGSIKSVLSIGVFYGKYLELSNGGKYRIIKPTMDSHRAEFKRRLKRVLSP